MPPQTPSTPRLEEILTSARPCRAFCRQLLAPLLRQKRALRPGVASESEREEQMARAVLEAVRLLIRSLEDTQESLEVPMSTASGSGALAVPRTPSPWSSSPSQPPHHVPHGPTDRGVLGNFGGSSWGPRSSEPAPLISPSSSCSASANSLAPLSDEGHPRAATALPVCPHTLLYMLHIVAARTAATREDGDARTPPVTTAASRALWLEALKQIALYFTLLDRRGLGQLVAGALLFGEPRFSPAWEAQQLNLYSLPPSITEPGERAPFQFYHCHCDGVGGNDDDDTSDEDGYSEDAHDGDDSTVRTYRTTRRTPTYSASARSLYRFPRRHQPRSRSARTASRGTNDSPSSHTSSTSSVTTTSLSTSSSSLASSPSMAGADDSSSSDPGRVSSPTRRASVTKLDDASVRKPGQVRTASTPLQPSLSFPVITSHGDSDHEDTTTNRSENTVRIASTEDGSVMTTETVSASGSGGCRSPRGVVGGAGSRVSHGEEGCPSTGGGSGTPRGDGARRSRAVATASVAGPAVPADMLSLSQHFQLVLYRLMDAHGASGHCAPAAVTVMALAHTRAVLTVLLALPLAPASATPAVTVAAGGGGSMLGVIAPGSPFLGYQGLAQQGTLPQPLSSQPYSLYTSPYSLGQPLNSTSSGASLGGGGSLGHAGTPLSGVLQPSTTAHSAATGPPHTGSTTAYAAARSTTSVPAPVTGAMGSIRRHGASSSGAHNSAVNASGGTGGPALASGRSYRSAGASFHSGAAGGSQRLESTGEYVMGSGGGGAGVAGYPSMGPATAAAGAGAAPFSATYLGHLVPFLTHQTLSVCTHSWQTLQQILILEPALAAPFLLYYMHEVVFDVILAHALLPQPALDVSESTSVGDSRAEAGSRLEATSPRSFAAKRAERPQLAVPPHFIAQQEALSLLVRILRDNAYLEAHTRFRLSPALLSGVLTLISSYHTIVFTREAQWRRRQHRLMQRVMLASTTATDPSWRPHAAPHVPPAVSDVDTAPVGASAINAPSSPSHSPRASAMSAAHRAEQPSRSVHQSSENEADVDGHDYSDDDDTDLSDDADGLGEFEQVTSVLDLIPYRHRAAMRLCFEALCEFIVQQDKSTPIRALILMNMDLLRAFIEIAAVLPPVLFSHSDADTRAAGAAEVLDRQRLLYLLNHTTPLSAEERYEMDLG